MSEVLAKPWILTKALRPMQGKVSSMIRRAYMSLLTMAIEIGGALIVIAIVIGTIAVPIFLQTNTTGWSTQNILIWGTILTVAFAALIMGIIALFRRAAGGAE